MPFTDMMKDQISLIKQNGERFDSMRASVQGNKVFYMQAKPLIESGDEIIRFASNGGEDHMVVIDPGFNEAFEEIPAHYQMTVQKQGGYRPPTSPQPSPVVYNLTGDNARINHGSVDNSVNIVRREEVSVKLIQELRDLIAKADIPTAEREVAADALDVVETQFQSGRPKASIVTRMLDTMPKLAEAGIAVAKLIALVQGTPGSI